MFSLFTVLLFVLQFSFSSQIPFTPPVAKKPAEAHVSKELAWRDQGFHIVGDRCKSEGDVIGMTYCYCGDPDFEDLSSSWPEAHYVEVSYWNRHWNATYHLTETCKSNIRMDCLGHKWDFQNEHDLDSPMGAEQRPYAQDEWGRGYREIQWNGACGYFSSQLRNHNGYQVKYYPWVGLPADFLGIFVDRFCFFPNPGDQHEYPMSEGKTDRVYYNGQRRWLRDGQGFTDWADQPVRDICSDKCIEKTGLPIMPYHQDQVPSHQACALDVDDMCKACT